MKDIEIEKLKIIAQRLERAWRKKPKFSYSEAKAMAKFLTAYEWYVNAPVEEKGK